MGYIARAFCPIGQSDYRKIIKHLLKIGYKDNREKEDKQLFYGTIIICDGFLDVDRYYSDAQKLNSNVPVDNFFIDVCQPLSIYGDSSYVMKVFLEIAEMRDDSNKDQWVERSYISFSPKMTIKKIEKVEDVCPYDLRLTPYEFYDNVIFNNIRL